MGESALETLSKESKILYCLVHTHPSSVRFLLFPVYFLENGG